MGCKLRLCSQLLRTKQLYSVRISGEISHFTAPAALLVVQTFGFLTFPRRSRGVQP